MATSSILDEAAPLHISETEQKLWQFSPLIIESMLRGLDVKALFPDFLRLHCSKFSQFREICEHVSVHGPCHGVGFDLQMQLVHNEFLTDLERLLDDKLKMIGVPSAAWEASVVAMLAAAGADCDASSSSGAGSGAATDTAALQQFVQTLQQYQDFFAFGRMMQDLCRELYGGGAGTGGVRNKDGEQAAGGNGKTNRDEGVIIAGNAVMRGGRTGNDSGSGSNNPSAGASASATPQPAHLPDINGGGCRVVRVLWDLENVCPAHSRTDRLKGRGGSATLHTVLLLQQFLERSKLAGEGIDCRITTFVNFLDVPKSPAPEASQASEGGAPEGAANRPSQQQRRNPLSRSIIDDLDRAGVEIVFASRKREDADRKLTHRVMQDMEAYGTAGAGGCVFVLVTSDQDFRTVVQVATGRGFPVLWLHQAPEGSRWQQTIALSASRAVNWDSEVMGEGATGNADDEAKSGGGAKGGNRGHGRDNGKDNGRGNGNGNGNGRGGAQGGKGDNGQRQADATHTKGKATENRGPAPVAGAGAGTATCGSYAAAVAGVSVSDEGGAAGRGKRRGSGSKEKSAATGEFGARVIARKCKRAYCLAEVLESWPLDASIATSCPCPQPGDTIYVHSSSMTMPQQPSDGGDSEPPAFTKKQVLECRAVGRNSKGWCSLSTFVLSK